MRDAFRVVRQVAREWALGKAWENLPPKAKQFFIDREIKKIKKKEDEERQAEADAQGLRGVAFTSTPTAEVAPPVSPEEGS